MTAMLERNMVHGGAGRLLAGTVSDLQWRVSVEHTGPAGRPSRCTA